ncbi:expressed unknown protein [Seminavis robusta]|uniref:Uncharacterized protein n=1 Tax=Seminavis robusta TaxID=568900 RepID=A0A9N8EGF3_9STRA|nr:expressed unknown protein [Seminavis robusta]|eukprot:Sro907_g218810.1 n/a (299) ;mRNA; f:38784-39680
MAAEEDVILFGDSNDRLSDALKEKVEAALQSGVASLPLISNGDNDDEDGRHPTMLRWLRSSYDKYLHLTKLYGDQHIFTVAHRTSHFRNRIVREFQQEEGSNDGHGGTTISTTQETSDDDKETATTMTTSTTTTNVKMVTAQDIPSPTELTALDDQIQTLRGKLQQARQKRIQQQLDINKMQQKAQWAQETNQSIQQHTTSKIVQELPPKVHAMVAGRDQLLHAQAKGHELMATMKQEKQQQQSTTRKKGTTESAQNNKSKKKKPKLLTLADQFQQDQRHLQGTTVEELQEIRQMMQK